MIRIHLIVCGESMYNGLYVPSGLLIVVAQLKDVGGSYSERHDCDWIGHMPSFSLF